MNKKIQHIRALVANTAAIALLMLAPTACVNSLPGEEDPGTGTNPEAMLDPNTPVGITATLGTYGTASPTRSAAEPARATSTQLAAIPAEGEITAASTLTGDIESKFQFYGIVTSTPTYKATGTVGAPVLSDAVGNTVSLIMSDFNTSATNTNNEKQRHSRLGSLHFNNSNTQDVLIGFADRTMAADRKSAVYGFALRHATAKVSVLVVDAASVPINLTASLDGTATLTAYNSLSCSFETENPTSDTPHMLLSTYMNTKNAAGDYPSTTTANATFANYYTESSSSRDLKQPAVSANSPANLLNAIVCTNPTVTEKKTAGDNSYNYYPYLAVGDKVTDITAIATGLSGANNPVAVLPFDATAGKANPHRITLSLKEDAENGVSAGTYGINLTDIVLTGLPAGDGRIAAPSAAEPTRAESTTGTLRYLLPGEHVVVTLKIDRNKILSATAILAPWTEATADGGNLGDADISGGGGEMVVPFGDKDFSAALAAMTFNADGNSGGNQKLTLNAKGCIDITNADNLTLISKIKKLDVNWKYIKSLKGIEYFTSLTYLDCRINSLTTLDLSANTKLTYLDCYNNSLTTLDLSANTGLTELDCSSNKLTTLDLSANTGLTELDCSYNNALTTLNVTANAKLTELNCYNNALAALNVTANTKLNTLNCSNNQLTTIDVSKNANLYTLNCSNNQLTTIDVSKNANLSNLNCYNNALAALNVTANTKLNTLNCYNNALTTLDVTANTELNTLNCSNSSDNKSGNNNSLGTLDVSKNANLYTLNCSNTNLTTIDVSKNANLSNLYCSNNQLGTLDVSKNANLYTLNCSNNQLTTIDVTTNANLGILNCSNNQLGTLNVSKNANLTYLYCSSTNLTVLDVSNNANLNKLFCDDNHLTELDASKIVLDRWSPYYELYCGNQTTNGIVQNLALTLGQQHKSNWSSLKNQPNNKDVTVSYIN